MRASTRVSKFQGANATIIKTTDKFVPAFPGGTGSERTQPASAFLADATVPAYVDTLTFNVVKSFYVTKGASDRQSSVLALLTIDSARVNGVSPMKMLDQLNIAELRLSDDLMYIINILNESTSKVATAVVLSNNLSYKSSYIKV